MKNSRSLILSIAFIGIVITAFKSGRPETTTNPAGAKTYTFKEQGLSIELPQGWEQQQAMLVMRDMAITTFSMKCENTVKVCPMVALAVMPKDSLSLQARTDYMMGRLKNKYTDFELVKKEQRTINSIPASIIEYKGTKKYQETRLHFITTVYRIKEKDIILDCEAASEPDAKFQSDKKAFDVAINSVKQL